MKITDAPVKFNTGPKIPTAADAAKHKGQLGDSIEEPNQVY